MFIKRLLIALFLLLPVNAFAADSTVTALTAASALNGTELFYCVQSGADRKCTGAQAGTYILASPVLTGTPTIPTPFTLGATSVTSTGTQLNYLNAATGTTGTTSTNIVFSTSPTLITPALGTPSALVLTNATGLPNASVIGLAASATTDTTNATNIASGTLNNARLPTRSSLSGSPSNQTTASGTQTMVGAGTTCAITPATSTRLLVIFSGILNNSGASQTVTTQLRFGTGAAPANAAAVTGTTTGNALAVTNLVANSNQQFVLQSIITGLTASTAYWIDFSGSATSNTTSWSSLNCVAMEF